MQGGENVIMNHSRPQLVKLINAHVRLHHVLKPEPQRFVQC